MEYVQVAGMQVQPLKNVMRQHEPLREVVEAFHADALILADFHNLYLEPAIIDADALAMLPIPCATFDSMAFGPDERVLLNCLIRPQDEKRFRGKYKRYTTLGAIAEHLTILRTCPLNAPVSNQGRIRSIKLYDAPFTISPEKRREVRHRLGITRDEEKLVMFAKASWATIGVKLRIAQQVGSRASVTYSYETFLQDLLVHYLSQVDVPVKVVGVTSDPKQDITLKSQGHIQFIGMPFLNIDEYADLLFSCDLFITDNLTSCSMAKAVFGHVPVLSLINTRLTGTPDGSPLTFPENMTCSPEIAELFQHWNCLLPGGIYPFYVYPNGWIEELAPLLHENPYFQAVATAEMFAVEETTTVFTELLCDEEKIQQWKARQGEYIEKVLSLPDTYDSISQWISEAQRERK